MSKELSEVKQLIAFMQGVEAEVKALEEQLEVKKDQVHMFKTDIIPEHLMSLGLEQAKLDTGEVITVKTAYFGNISEARAEVAYKWLRDNGYHTKIKTTIALSFGADMESIIDHKVLENFLKEHDIVYSEKEGIHAQTLKSTIKECMEAGENFPQELFGVHIAKEVIVEKSNKP